MRSRIILAAVIAALCLPHTAAAQDASAPEASVSAIDVKVGDTWIYKLTDEITGRITATLTYVVTEHEDHTITALVTYDGGPGRVSSNPNLFSEEWGLINNNTWKYNKPDMAYGFKLPFQVGSKWDSSVDATRANPDMTSHVYSFASVAGKDKITVPSGDTYDAFRIEGGYAANSATSGGKTTTKSTTWYSPSVNRYVQRVIETRNNGMLTTKTKEYLISYNRRPLL